MNNIVSSMMEGYKPANTAEAKQAIREVLQEIVLAGLSKAGFFKKAAFYGGTSLRIYHGLDRFSEDLDFSLFEPDSAFSFVPYFSAIEYEAAANGFKVSLEEKKKTAETSTVSSFLRGNTREELLYVFPESAAFSVPHNEVTKIKIEADVNPPKGGSYERKYRLLPSPFECCLFDLPCLFAGKISALLCRGWKSRTKGRDLYDYLFYLRKGVKVNLPYLRERLIRSGYLKEEAPYTLSDLKKDLFMKFERIDYKVASQDVEPFIKNKSALALWGPDFFKALTEELEAA